MADKSKRTKVAGNFFRASIFALLLVALRGSAENMTIAWTPSTSPEVAGFKIYYGPSSRVYTQALTVGNVSKLVISGLVGGNKYFLAVTSCDETGAESAFSDEIVYVAPLTVFAKNKNTSSTAIAPAGIGTRIAPAPKSDAPVSDPVAQSRATNPGSNADSNPGSNVGSNASAATEASNLSVASTNAEAVSCTSQNVAVAKAKVATASKPATSNGTYQAKTLDSNSQESAPSVTAPTLAETVAARAAQFYAAVTPPDMQGNCRLDVDEQMALMDSFMTDASPFIGAKLDNVATPSEALEVVSSITNLHQQIARFDADQDGELVAAEQSMLVAALETDEKLFPIFAPLMPDREPIQSR